MLESVWKSGRILYRSDTWDKTLANLSKRDFGEEN